MKRTLDKITRIPIDKIAVINPRSRGKAKFRQIVDNIARLGLKKPITVALSDCENGEQKYNLVCGQGRLEAFKALGEEEIPAIIVEGSQEDMLLMSLAENLARRQHSSVELIRDIRVLKERGYSYTEIAKKIDLATSYVRGILQLLERGEERLIRAVEKRQIPITIAITVARSDDAAVQRALTEAYESNTLRGKQVLTARRIIESRRTHGKSGKRSTNGTTSKDILKTYRRETTRQRHVIQKARLCETRLLFAVSAIKQLFGDDDFVDVIRAESLDSLPKYLADEISKTQGAE